MSSLTIIGSGNMARGIAFRARAGGHEVQILARRLDKAKELAEDLDISSAGELTDVIEGDLVVLAVPYVAALALVNELGSRLAGKVILDISNPVDFATFSGMVTPADSSAAQEIARCAPSSAAVVKAFNTTFAGTLLAGEVGGHPLDVFIAANDADAKAVTAAVIESVGLRPVDVGDLHMARYLEGLGFLHMAAQTTQGGSFATTVKLLGA